MNNDELKNKTSNERIQTVLASVLDNYSATEKGIISTSDMIRAAKLLYEINVEINKAKLSSDMEIIVEWDLFAAINNKKENDEILNNENDESND